MGGKNDDSPNLLIEAGGPLIEAVAGFVPIAGPLLSVIIRQIFDLTEKAEHNKKICRRLAERVRVASLNLERQHERPDDVALNQYKDAIFECKNFIEKISKTSTFMKFITGKDVEWQFNEINRNLDSAIGQLGLEEIMRTREEIEEDGTLLRSEMRSTLGVIEEVMKNVFKEGMDTKKKVEVLDSKIDAMHNAVNNLSSGLQIPKNLGLTRIECKHIVEIDGGDNDDNNEIKNQSQFIGSIGQVRKMRYITQIVSEKEIGPINSLSRPLETIEKEVAILTELKDCEYIIRFYGTMQRAGKLYIISEWADSGDLNTYLKGNPNLPWSFKIKIATEIASGLVFCHTFDILHHDIRSHNILLTDKLSAKLSNFSSSRKETDNTSQVNDIHSIYRWLAPEKVLHYRENSYTKQCDIYSFAIVLWELASQELPYGEITKPNKLIETIKSGQRPRLIPGTPPIFERIMQQGWHQRPIKRPTASYMFKELNGINRPCGEPESIRPLSSNSIIIPRSSTILASSEDSTQVNIDLMNDIKSIKPVLDISDAKRLHDQKLYSEAWQIFKMYADLGDPIAQYYVGYYLITGNHSVLRDTKKAVEYFRRSAEKGIPGAQLRYSVALLKGDGIEKNEANDRIAIENLKKAAISGNPHAMFNYGDILINGGHGVWENIEEGEIWMRAAHDKGHPHALKKLTDRLNSLNKYPSM